MSSVPWSRVRRALDRGVAAVVDAGEAAELRARSSRRRRLVSASRGCATPAAHYRFAAEHVGRGPTQIESEILAFVDKAQGIAPQRICEIGTEWGGTSYLLAHALPTAAHVIGIDLWVRNKALLRALTRPGQRLDLIDGSSRKPARVARVQRILGGRQLDVLFIDGDHSFDGVRADFLAYRHLVRDGGLIAFHDIVPVGEDAAPGGAYVGDVPSFWPLVRDAYVSEELIARPDQEGFGIGVLEYDAKVPPPPALLQAR